MKLISPQKIIELSDILSYFEEHGFTPLGVVAYSVEKDQLDIITFKSMDLGEVGALLQKINVYMQKKERL